MADISNDIKNAKKQAQKVIVFFHWGNEFTRKINPKQKELAHQSIDSGADIVLGTHPHVVQPLEIYKNKLIAYSLGNFIFDQQWSKPMDEGMIIRIIFYKRSIADIQLIPIKLNNKGQPYILTGTAKSDFLDLIRGLSIE